MAIRMFNPVLMVTMSLLGLLLSGDCSGSEITSEAFREARQKICDQYVDYSAEGAIPANPQRIKALLVSFEKELRDEVWPFWLKHGLDNEFGGVYSDLNAQGTEHGPNKSLVGQARMIYVLSQASLVFPDLREKFMPLADRIVDFMIAHFQDKEFGGWYWAVNRKGVPTSTFDKHKAFYGQIFVIYGLSYYLKAGGIRPVKPVIENTFDLLQSRFYNADADVYVAGFNYDWEKSTASTRVSMGDHLHYLEAMIALFEAIPKEKYRREIRHVADIVWGSMWDDSVGMPYEFFDVNPDLRLVKDINKRYVRKLNAIRTIICTGHQMEHSYLLMRSALHDGGRPYIRRGISLLNQAWAKGWMRDGLPYGMQEWFRNGKLDYMMRWWMQPEGMNANAHAYLYTGDQKYIKRVEDLYTVYLKYYADRQYGDSYKCAPDPDNFLKRTEAYKKRAALKGAGMTNCYHTTRALTNSIVTLRKALEKFPAPVEK